MPRFVILHHVTPADYVRPTHWDLMLERNGRLATWALAEPPAAHGSVPAEHLPDHRLAYLDYEGPVSGNRGTVSRWDAGSYATQRWEDARICVKLQGAKLAAELTLVKETDAASQCWRMFLSTSDSTSDVNE